MRKGYLVLEDGESFAGQRFGGEGNPMGELVFNTSAGGYLETITDPGFAGQIVVETYPLIGNYGVDHDELEGPCRLRGLVVRELCDTPSNFRCTETLEEFLCRENVPGLCGVDTRALTGILREKGPMRACICDEIPADLSALKSFRVYEPVAERESEEIPAQGEQRFHVTVVDLGVKKSVLRELTQRGCALTVVSGLRTAEEILASAPDGVFLSNGPGNPEDYGPQVETVKALMGRVPVFGAGLGHQLCALAQGGKCAVMQRGHRGGNQPVRDVKGTRTYVTGQNYGYCVDAKSVPGAELRYVNVNDGTCEGLDYPALRAFTVQFQPEACCDRGNNFLFDRFCDLMKGEC